MNVLRLRGGTAYECFMMFRYSILPCLSLGHIFSFFYQFEPQCSYKRVLIKKNSVHDKVSHGKVQSCVRVACDR